MVRSYMLEGDGQWSGREYLYLDKAVRIGGASQIKEFRA